MISSYSAHLICPTDWELFGDLCYKSLIGKMTFDMAVINCNATGGHVAIPTSLKDHQFIWEMGSKVATDTVWVGCTDEEEEGKWVEYGQGGKECSFLDWYPGEPNGGSDSDISCVRMRPIYNSQLIDVPCYWQSKVVCQRPAVAPTTTPISL